MASGSLGQNLMATYEPGGTDWHRWHENPFEKGLHGKKHSPIAPSLLSLCQELAAQILRHPVRSGKPGRIKCHK